MVNAPTIVAAACQHQAWLQRGKHSKSCSNAFKFTPRSRPSGVRAVCIQQLRCSATNQSTGSRSACLDNRLQNLTGSEPNHVCIRSPNLAEVLLKVSCRLIEALATLSLLTQPLLAVAGEIIQGTPRISDGDTIQVESPKSHNSQVSAPRVASSLHMLKHCRYRHHCSTDVPLHAD